MSLNAEQQQAVDLTLAHPATSMLVVGGPGSGKTHTLTHTCMGLLREHSVPPADILMVTFTRAAADEMESRMSRVLGHPSGIASGTFHSLAYAHLQNMGKRCHLVAQDALKDAAVRYVLSQDEEEMNGQTFDSEDERQKARKTGLYALNAALLWREGAATACPTARQQRFLAMYDALKTREGGMDFHDLLLQMEAELDQFHAFKHVLVDEVQDLNPIQLRLLQGLHRRGAQIVAIGDDNQAIYGFRGSNVEHLLQFDTHFAPAQQMVLRNNYRNPAAVVELAQRTIAQIRGRIKREVVVRSTRTDPIEYGVPPSKVVDRIVQHQGTRQFVIARERAQLDAIGQALEERGISFTRRQAPSGIELSALTAVAHLQAGRPELAQPHWDAVARAVDPDHPALPLSGLLTDPGGLPPALAMLWTALQAAVAAPTLVTSLQALAAVDALRAAVHTMLQATQHFPEEQAPGLLTFLAEHLLDLQRQDAECGVVLLTAHQAKGLEAEVVHLLGVESFGARSRSTKDKDEEVRVLFVALTRTQGVLYLSWETLPRLLP